MKHSILFLSFLVLTCSASAQDVNPQQAFYKGRECFDKGQFSEAIESYKSALKAGASRELLFNLGTSCLFAGRNGEALYYLRRAEQLAPRDEDIQKNIEIARNRAKNKSGIDTQTKFVSALLYVHQKLTINEAIVLFIVLYVLGMALLHVRLIAKGRWYLRVGVLFVVLALLVGYSAMSRASQLDSKSEGVILPAKVDVFSGPSDHTYAAYFELLAGAEVKVLEVKNGWVKIAYNDKKGFVPQNQIGLL